MPNPATHASDVQHPAVHLDIEFKKKLSLALDKSSLSVKNKLKEVLYNYLSKAAVTEHLLSLQYLYTAFSLKKFPQEFEDYNTGNPQTDQKRLSQIEMIRRWEAKILFVARQEMEHLAMVQNLVAILDEDPFLFRPNFPVRADQVVLGKPINLMPFSLHAMEIFRYWEKPDRLHLPDPFRLKVPAAIKAMASKVPHPTSAKLFNYADTTDRAWKQIENILTETNDVQDHSLDTIEELYTFISVFFYFLIHYKVIQGTNYNRVVNEHFGFNMSLDPIVDEKYYQYVQAIIQQIIQEGEGVWGVPPPLESHFMVFQTIISELNEECAASPKFKASLPCVWNPTVSAIQDEHNVSLPGSIQKPGDSAVVVITNEVAIAAMNLFNDAYYVLVQMLHGFFKKYAVNNTTGIHPPKVNAFFQTAYYPFMTMVIRPLGEMICRLPAEKNYIPQGNKVPPKTAGPNFFFSISQQADSKQIEAFFSTHDDMEAFLLIFRKMAKDAATIGTWCREKGYHIANYEEKDARDFDTRFQYLSENLIRISQNFEAYWQGKIVAPIPSEGFQNFSDTYN